MPEESSKIILTSTILHIPGFSRGKNNTFHSAQTPRLSYNVCLSKSRMCLPSFFFFLLGFKLVLRGKVHSNMTLITIDNSWANTCQWPWQPVVLDRITVVPHESCTLANTWTATHSLRCSAVDFSRSFCEKFSQRLEPVLETIRQDYNPAKLGLRRKSRWRKRV